MSVGTLVRCCVVRNDGVMIDELAALHGATRILTRGVDALSDAELAEPSLLPGWTRAHVVAHLALNAEGLAGVLRAAAGGGVAPMYASQEQRDGDIETLGATSPTQLRDRFLASCTAFQDALDHLPAEAWTGSFDRTPGGQRLPLAEVPAMRRREVEIHHADLDHAYRPADWPEEFVDTVFNRVVHDREAGASMMLRTPDGDVPLGDGTGPVVSGSRVDLAWWLLGRGKGEGLTADPALPTLGAWR